MMLFTRLSIDILRCSLSLPTDSHVPFIESPKISPQEESPKISSCSPPVFLYTSHVSAL